MDVIRSVVTMGFQIETLDNVQHLERDRALRVLAHFINFISAVIRVDRIDPVGIELGKIRRGQQTVVPAGKFHNLLSKLALIEDIAATVSNQLQGTAKAGISEDLAMTWSGAIQQIRSCRVRRVPQFLFVTLPLSGNDFRYGKPSFSIFDRGFKQPRHRQPAVFSMQFEPAGDGARHRNRVHAGNGNPVEAARSEKIHRGMGAGPAAAIESDGHTILLHKEHGKHVAADSGHHRLDNVQYRSRRNRRIDGVSAVLKNPKRCHRREWLAGGHHAVHRKYRRPSTLRIGRRPVAMPCLDHAASLLPAIPKVVPLVTAKKTTRW